MHEQQAEFHQGFIARLNQFVTDLGIDPTDKRIDWAANAKNYLDAMERVQRSAAKIQKENTQAAQSGLEERLKTLEAKIKAQETEVNSVETSTPSGVVASSDANFLKEFGAGNLPMSKENIARYDKIKSAY